MLTPTFDLDLQNPLPRSSDEEEDSEEEDLETEIGLGSGDTEIAVGRSSCLEEDGNETSETGQVSSFGLLRHG